MDNVSNLISGIYNKTTSLISLLKSMKDQNKALTDKRDELKLIIENQNKIIEQLKEKNSNLKIAKYVKQSEGNVDVKDKIDELVREVDKCIGLLNK